MARAANPGMAEQQPGMASGQPGRAGQAYPGAPGAGSQPSATGS
jgi:hypothetical protein